MTATTAPSTYRTGSTFKCAFCELVGTYFLVLAGTFAIIESGLYKAPGDLGVAMTFGIVLTALVLAFGSLGGGHFNPAVTIGLLLARLFPFRAVVPYIIAQFVGAYLASLTAWFTFDVAGVNQSLLGAPIPTVSATVLGAFMIEALLTALLVLVILVVSARRELPGFLTAFAAGSALFVGVLVGGPISGGSLNPARALGPMLVSWTFEGWFLWAFMFGPLIGSVMAVIIFKMVSSIVPPAP